MKMTDAQKIANYDQRKAGADDILRDFVIDLRESMNSGEPEPEAMRDLVGVLHRAFRQAAGPDYRLAITQALELLAFSVLREAKKP